MGGPPVGPRLGWAEAESTLGVVFPDDYRAVVDAYGWGTIGQELALYDPCHADLYWSRVGRSLQLLRDAHGRRSDEYPLPGFPSPGERSLLTIASNGNADDVFLVVDDGQASDAELWIGNVGDQAFLQVAGPLSSLLVAILRRTGPFDEVVGAFGEFAWALDATFQGTTSA